MSGFDRGLCQAAERRPPECSRSSPRTRRGVLRRNADMLSGCRGEGRRSWWKVRYPATVRVAVATSTASRDAEAAGSPKQQS